MLLKIQKEESLLSFIARNSFQNGQNDEELFFNRFPKCSLKGQHVKALAEKMGMGGCYGFNKLLHEHTTYPLKATLARSEDNFYSGTEYWMPKEASFSKDGFGASFCPECVRSDIKNLGFSFWRRSHGLDISVCIEHNVLLVKVCPFCGKNFGRGGHNLNVMWETCHGKHLSEISAAGNHNQVEYLRGSAFNGFLLCDIKFSIDKTLNILCDKIRDTPITRNNDLQTLRFILKRKAMLDYGFYESPKPLEIIRAILELYENFEEFEADFKKSGGETVKLKEFWGMENLC